MIAVVVLSAKFFKKLFFYLSILVYTCIYFIRSFLYEPHSTLHFLVRVHKASESLFHANNIKGVCAITTTEDADDDDDVWSECTIGF